MAIVHVDNDMLIEEVKKRPCLYRKEHPRYIDAIYKQAMWEDIAAKLLNKNWYKYICKERRDQVKALIKRWKNIRNCFMREVRTQKKIKQRYGSYTSRTRREYRYYQQLLFLRSEVEPQDKGPQDSLDEQIDITSTSEEEVEEIPAKPEFKTYTRTTPKIVKVSKKLQEIISLENVQLDVEDNGTNVTSTTKINAEDITSNEFSVDGVKVERWSPVRDIIVKIERSREPILTRAKARKASLIKGDMSETVTKGKKSRPTKKKSVGTRTKVEKSSPVREITNKPMVVDEEPGLVTHNPTETAIKVERSGVTKADAVEASTSVERLSAANANTRATSEVDWTSFALSLVPMLKMLPVHKGLDAQIAILSTLNRCLYGDTNDSTTNMAAQDGSSNVGTGIGRIKSIKSEVNIDDNIISLN